jgi:hypothetical protein
MIFLGEFSHCGYKSFLKKLGNFVLIVWIREKNDEQMEKINKIYKPKNWKKKKKKNNGTEVYICVHSK